MKHRSPREQTEHAVAANDLAGLLAGRWPYYVPEAHMAPSNVPTNWEKILLEGVYPLADSNHTIAAQVVEALTSMAAAPESLYSAVAVFDAFLSHKASRLTDLSIDVDGVAQMLRDGIDRHADGLRQMSPQWMGDASERLWDRVEQLCRLIYEDHGIDLGVHPGGQSPSSPRDPKMRAANPRRQALLARALAMVKAEQAKVPEVLVFKSLVNQLQYLIDLDAGRRTDRELLRTITVGELVARELGGEDALTELLWEVVKEVGMMSWE